MTTPIHDPWSSVSVHNDHGLQDSPSIWGSIDTYSGKLHVVKTQWDIGECAQERLYAVNICTVRLAR